MDFENLHQILRSLYDEMMPLCSDMTDIAKGLAGLGALFYRLPNFLFEAPTFQPLSNEAKVLYAFILRRTDLSRKNGWADEYGRIYLYYPINEVVELLHCGRQKAVNTLRELQYAGLVEIQKQGCGKPNRIYPKSYEAVPNTDFKKSGYGTPEG